MSLLGDFAGNFLSIAGNNMQQQEDQDRAIRLQEEIERRRFARQQNMKAKTSLPEQRPVGAPYQDPQSGKWLQRTQQARQALLDENTGDVTQAAAWEDGQSVEVADPNALTPYQQAQIDQKELDRQNKLDVAGVRSSGKGGRGTSAGRDKYELRNIGGRVMRVNVSTGEQTDMGPASKSGDKAETKDAVRKTWTETAGAVASAEGEQLRSIALQWGMDQRDLPTDDETLRSAVLAQVDAEYGKRLNGGSKDEQIKPNQNDKPPVPGAKLSPKDGKWYVQKDGKWFLVEDE